MPPAAKGALPLWNPEEGAEWMRVWDGRGGTGTAAGGREREEKENMPPAAKGALPLWNPEEGRGADAGMTGTRGEEAGTAGKGLAPCGAP